MEPERNLDRSAEPAAEARRQPWETPRVVVAEAYSAENGSGGSADAGSGFS
jgi:hypothetical protein